MLENFNIQATKLKRQLKMSVYLPNDYNNTLDDYDSVFLLDGQNVFHDIYADNEQSMQLAKYLDEANVNKIVFAIHAPKNPDWRLSELIPFNLDNPKLEHVLADRFKEYIVGEFIALMETKYRLSNNKAIVGFKESAYTSLYIGYNNDTFKTIGIFSPSLYKYKDEYLSIIDNKMIYLFTGGYDDNDIESLGYSIYQYCDKNNMDNLIYDYEADKENNISSWPYHIIKLIQNM